MDTFRASSQLKKHPTVDEYNQHENEAYGVNGLGKKCNAGIVAGFGYDDDWLNVNSLLIRKLTET